MTASHRFTLARHCFLAAALLFSAVAAAGAQAAAPGPTTSTGRPVDPKAVENLNRINDERVRRGQAPLTAPGYTYVPAKDRAPVATPSAVPAAVAAAAPSPVPAASPVAAKPAAAATVAGPALPAKRLGWAELLNRPELWPVQCTLKETMEFQGGVTVRAGQKVKVDGLTSGEVELSTLDDKVHFVAGPEETDVLDVANAEYLKLSPRQREVSYAALVGHEERWPYRVKITQTFDLGGGKRVKAGDEAVLLKAERDKLVVLSEQLWMTYDVAPQATDLMAQARRYADDPSGMPSRVGSELQGKLVSSVTGVPAALDPARPLRYYVLYRGSSTCSITRGFTPKLVKFYEEMKPLHPEFEIVYIMTETPADTGKFARELGFSWPAVEYETTPRMLISGKAIGSLLPQLVVMDGTGKVLANGVQGTAPAALQKLEALLRQTPQ